MASWFPSVAGAGGEAIAPGHPGIMTRRARSGTDGQIDTAARRDHPLLHAGGKVADAIGVAKSAEGLELSGGRGVAQTSGGSAVAERRG